MLLTQHWSFIIIFSLTKWNFFTFFFYSCEFVLETLIFELNLLILIARLQLVQLLDGYYPIQLSMKIYLLFSHFFSTLLSVCILNIIIILQHHLPFQLYHQIDILLQKEKGRGMELKNFEILQTKSESWELGEWMIGWNQCQYSLSVLLTLDATCFFVIMNLLHFFFLYSTFSV